MRHNRLTTLGAAMLLLAAAGLSGCATLTGGGAAEPVPTPPETLPPGMQPITGEKLEGEALERHAGEPGVVTLRWSTQSEVDTFGYIIERGDHEEGPFTRQNEDIVAGAINSSTERTYVFHDLDVKVGERYFYRLVEVQMSGDQDVLDPTLPITVNRRYLGLESVTE